MQINPATGFFDVQPTESLTITVTASNTPYQVAFPANPTGAVWSQTQGPTGGVESRTFIAPAASGSQCFVVISFNFIPDATGAFPANAKYDIRVTGSAGGSFDDQPVVPPPLENRTFKFNVL